MQKILNLGKLPNEFLKELIQTLPTTDQELLIPPGVGLDAAGLNIGGRLIAVTTDPITFATDKLALYSIAVNSNDVACLGCEPRWYSATLLLPQGTTKKEVKKIWRELGTELKRHSLISIGGHVEVTAAVTTPIIIGQIIGKARRASFLDPRKGRAGHKILLCRPLAIEGTALLARERKKELLKLFTRAEIEQWQNLLYRPGIAIWESVAKIINCEGLIALHDLTEGGLANAAHELAEAANCGLRLDFNKIPILPATQKLANLFGFNPLGLLASGSFLIVAEASGVSEILQNLARDAVVEIGELTASRDERILVNTDIESELPRYIQDEVVVALNKKIKIAKVSRATRGSY